MDPHMYHYAPVSQALDELKEKGFTVDFNNQEGRIINSPDDFTIVHIYYYEGESDPGDEATVYGIKSSTGEQGVYVAGHQAYTDKSAAMVLNELSIRNKRDPDEHPEMNADCDECTTTTQAQKPKEAIKLIDHL